MSNAHIERAICVDRIRKRLAIPWQFAQLQRVKPPIQKRATPSGMNTHGFTGQSAKT
jgi:hypothetical protein